MPYADRDLLDRLTPRGCFRILRRLMVTLQTVTPKRKSKKADKAKTRHIGGP